MQILKRTKIITTIGPSSHSEEMIGKLFDAGMTTIRLNFSHGDFNEQGARITFAHNVSKKKGIPISVMLDTKGPEIRVGKFLNQSQQVTRDQEITIYTDEKSYLTKECQQGEMTVSHDMSVDLKVGNIVLVEDGKLELRVLEVKPGIVKTKAANDHILKYNKRINLPGVLFSMPFLSEKDINDIKYGCDLKVDFIAASFVSTAENVLQIRSILKEKNCEHIKVIPKIESQYAVDNFDQILKVADGIMVARGDLGLEIPYYEVPVVQKMMIRKCREVGKPVIIATQMLDSMEKNPHPTRAEVTDVYFATELGADATMLSGESAAGNYPVEAVKVMAAINQRAEQEFYNKLYYRVQLDAIAKISSGPRSQLAKTVAERTINNDYKFTVVLSRTGKLLSEVAKFRPNTNILGVTNDQNQVTLFGITSSVFMYPDIQMFNSIKTNVKEAKNVARLYGAQSGDKILIVDNEKIHDLII